MVTNELCIEEGKKYPIKQVIDDLRKNEEMKIGHAVIFGVHQYYLGVNELEKILENVKAKEKKLNTTITKDMMVLSIINPINKFKLYFPFYESIENDILKGIHQSTGGAVATNKETLISDASNRGFALAEKTDQKNFLTGLGLFFARRGISVDSKSKEYVFFRTKKC